MHPSVLAFAEGALCEADVKGRAVLEAGAYDVNGSVRPLVEALGPASYIGTDMTAGPGVDVVCAASGLPARFGRADVVISTEMLEHAADWQGSVAGMVSVLAEGGLLVLTTRSPGFPYHPFPDDFWRFPVETMRDILAGAGLLVERCEADPEAPGVFAVARKPEGWRPLSGWQDIEVERA